MFRIYQVIIALFFGILFYAGCDEGIQAPATSPTGGTGISGFSGIITYKNWPPPDSLLNLRLVAFRKFPPGNILTEVTTDSAIIYPPLVGGSSLPFNVDTTHYFTPASAGEYKYVVVAQQYGPNVLTDWRAIGQYDLDTNLAVPSAIQVPVHDTLKHVDINVDFNHLPPQPF